MGSGASQSTNKLLRSLRDRIVRLEEEKKSLADDIKDVYAEAKAQGFDVKALRRVVKDSQMDQTQRAAQRETESIVDVYRATLGILDGKPLGDDARQRFDQREEPSEEPRDKRSRKTDDAPDTPAADPASEAASADDEDEAPPATAEAPDERALEEGARGQGRSDFAAGQTVLQNPFPAGDMRRAAWDEGWCEASGSDGMDLPEAWRRRPPGGDQPARGA